MAFTVIIPARYASTRLPGKPLLDIAGKSMLQRVYERALQSAAERVIIATDDQRIVEVAEGFSAEVVMTDPDHESGTDRLQEVVSSLGFADDAIVVNVQGDEPLIPPEVINQVAKNLAENSEAGIATLVESIDEVATVFNPNAVKVCIDAQGRALYFSRAPIPWSRDTFQEDQKVLPNGVNFYRHIGIYAYRVSLLNQFVRWPVGMLEKTEKLEQLRAMENGVTILAQPAVTTIPAGVDTQEDLDMVRSLVGASGETL